MMEIERLERDLTALARAVAYPPTPPLAERVLERLAGPRPAPQRPSAWAYAGLAAALTIVLLSAIAGTVAPARDAIADIFDRINIFQTEQSPEGLPTEITGTPLTLEQAEMRLGFPVLLPTYPQRPQPDRVLFQDFGAVKAAVLFFDLSGGRQFALFETNGRVGKGLPFSGTAQATVVYGVGSGEAYWLEGLRIVQYTDVEGRVIPESVRATDVNTLLWAEGEVVFRIEGDLPQDDAVKIARSLE